jgi:hypothetical protein
MSHSVDDDSAFLSEATSFLYGRITGSPWDLSYLKLTLCGLTADAFHAVCGEAQMERRFAASRMRSDAYAGMDQQVHCDISSSNPQYPMSISITSRKNSASTYDLTVTMKSFEKERYFRLLTAATMINHPRLGSGTPFGGISKEVFHNQILSRVAPRHHKILETRNPETFLSLVTLIHEKNVLDEVLQSRWLGRMEAELKFVLPSAEEVVSMREAVIQTFRQWGVEVVRRGPYESEINFYLGDHNGFEFAFNTQTRTITVSLTAPHPQRVESVTLRDHHSFLYCIHLLQGAIVRAAPRLTS